jgi:hypothetical protein
MVFFVDVTSRGNMPPGNILSVGRTPVGRMPPVGKMPVGNRPPNCRGSTAACVAEPKGKESV